MEPQQPTQMPLQVSSQSTDRNPSRPLEDPKHHYHIHVQDGTPSPLRFHDDSDYKNDWRSTSSTSSPRPSTQSNSEENALQGLPSVSVHVGKEPGTSEASPEDSERERLKRHRREVAGRVWIPDIWGQEELLKDWIDCAAFDASLVPTGIMSARAALVEEGRRANSGRLRIVNRC
ncbi:protein BIC1 [Ziziphus jujuba]|uniref:Protein BIC1 n=1 Tax=Ziziphus jujuba TaxID=326968 RepID=A0A6P4B8Y5_ZIZJJ|nr:protein BIC1 [Ziziphus jujuba]